MPQKTLIKGCLINVIYKCMYRASYTDTPDCMWIYACEWKCLRNGWFPDVAWWETGLSANRRWSGLTLISSWNQSQIFQKRERERVTERKLTGKERKMEGEALATTKELIHYAKQTFLTRQQQFHFCLAICCTKWFVHFRKRPFVRGSSNGERKKNRNLFPFNFLLQILPSFKLPLSHPSWYQYLHTSL